jgi:acyl-CoA-binding protein
MQKDDLKTRFEAAIELANKISQSELPQDVQLRLYAYYKRATNSNIGYSNSGNFDLRNAFKLNAWIQISHLTEAEAKKFYIEAINEAFKNIK